MPEALLLAKEGRPAHGAIVEVGMPQGLSRRRGWGAGQPRRILLVRTLPSVRLRTPRWRRWARAPATGGVAAAAVVAAITAPRRGAAVAATAAAAAAPLAVPVAVVPPVVPVLRAAAPAATPGPAP